jgi:hypothetical protein
LLLHRCYFMCFFYLLQPAEEAEMIKAEENRLRHTFDV